MNYLIILLGQLLMAGSAIVGLAKISPIAGIVFAFGLGLLMAVYVRIAIAHTAEQRRVYEQAVKEMKHRGN